MVDCYSPITGHDAEKPRSVVPSPASDAGTNRRRHRNRLTPRHPPAGRPEPRLPSQDGPHVPKRCLRHEPSRPRMIRLPQGSGRPASTSSRRSRVCDVRSAVGWRSCTPQLGRCVMADVGPARHQSDDGRRPQERSNGYLTRDIGIPADLVEAPAEQHLGSQTSCASLCSAERLARIERGWGLSGCRDAHDPAPPSN
jgi:hypothetical protein